MNIVQKNITLILVAFSIIAFVLFLFLSLKIFDNNNFYYVVLNDANGLNENDLVYIENESLGKIKKIDTVSIGSEKILFKLTLNRNVNLPDRSTVHLAQLPNENKRRIEIQMKPSSGYFSPKDTLPLFSPDVLVENIEKPTIADEKIIAKADTVIVKKINEVVKPEVQKSAARPAVPQIKKNQVIFKVQFFVSPTELPVDSKKLKEIKQVSFYIDKGMYKYVSGKETDLSKAINLCEKIKAQGFQDAFVVAFDGDKRISVKEAQQLMKK